MDGRRDLEAVQKNALLPLKLDVLGPLNKASQIALGLDILTNAEVLGPLLEEGGFGSNPRDSDDLLLGLNSLLGDNLFGVLSTLLGSGGL